MKFFLDTANLDQIREAYAMGVLDGVTTNPSLMAKEGIKGKENQYKHYIDICNIVNGDVSAEVIGKGIKTNCTLVFSLGQALLAAKAGATYVSPFVGRLDDISEDGVGLIEEIVEMYNYYGFGTMVLAASIRHTRHIIDCLKAGADVATCPLPAIKGLLKHPLTDSGLAKFLEDYHKVNG